jgi:hypothetical protein
MSKGSRLCRTCRSRAISLGVTAVAERTSLAASSHGDTEPLTDGQRRALHAKSGELGRLCGQPKTTIVSGALATAAQRLGRPITSVNDLTRAEASAVLDGLEEELAARAAAGADS